MRIHLRNPSANTSAIGSSVRLDYGDGRKGPRREIQASSGHWSQNSATQVMGYTGRVQSIEVTWFDGSVQAVDVVADKDEYAITY